MYTERSNYWQRRALGRRRLLGSTLAGAAGIAGMATVGCGDDDDSATPTGGATTGASGSPTQAGNGGQPKRGGVWRGVMPGDPANIDPYAGTAYTTTVACAFCYSRLFRFKTGPGVDPGLYQTEPDLAESMSVSDDGLTYTVRLRTSARWHPPINRPLDADDVVFSWQRYTGQIDGTPAHASAPSMNTYLESVEKVDSSTVVFKLKQTRGDLFVSENRWLQIMPREAGTAFNPAQQMIGTGPWIFDSYATGSLIKFKRNPEWHLGPDIPYMDSVEISFVPEYATRFNQFLGGNLDHVDIEGSDLARALDTLEGMNLVVGESNLPASLIAFDGRPGAADAPWRDPRVRKALSMAIDRDALLDAAYNLKEIEKLNIGAKRRWNNEVPSLESAYWLDPQGQFQSQPSDPKMTPENQESFRYSPDDAKKLLEAAGFPDGFKTQLHSTATVYGQAFNTMSQLIQQYAGQVGIELELLDDDYASVYIQQIVKGEIDGLAHIPRGAGARYQFEGYYIPERPANYGRIDDQVLIDRIQAMLSNRDSEAVRLEILDLQNYVNDKMYYVPMQMGASGLYFGYAPAVRGAADYQVNTFDQGNETIPYYWKA